MRLWEAKHPYYCNENNFYANGCCTSYESWACFFEAYDPAETDFDYNLVFRWDWAAPAPDDRIQQHRLTVFWMGQRRGRFWSSIVNVTPADEPAVRAWLEPRWAQMQALWAPLGGQNG